MIIRSWERRGGPVELHAWLVREETPAVHIGVRHGLAVLSGQSVARGHRCRFLLGFWEVTEPAINQTFGSGVRRMNVPADFVAAAVRADLALWSAAREVGGRDVDVPAADLVECFETREMKRLSLTMEVMGS